MEHLPRLQLLSCDLIPLLHQDEPRRGGHHTERVKEEHRWSAEDSVRLEGEGERSVCLPPARLWEVVQKSKKATCDLSSNLT